jgi:heme A synthase
MDSAPDRLRRFRRLVNLTIAATALLVVVGGIVRVSDSGLGCGTPGSGTEGWPLCGGRVIPLIQERAVVEFSHRLLASIVVVLIGLLVWHSLRRLREQRWLVRGSLAAAVLVLAQAGLGGLTVEKNLHDVLVAAHLGMAMLLLGTLIALSWAARPEAQGRGGLAGERILARLAVLATVLVLATIVAGGYVAGTEEEGAVNGAGGGAHLACGDQFPNCNGELFPFGRTRLVDIQLVHRGLMLATAIAVLGFVALALRRGMRSRLLGVLVAILAAQILLGAVNVWAGKHPGLVVAHLALGTTLWATMLVTSLQLARAPAATPGTDGRADGAPAIA